MPLKSEIDQIEKNYRNIGNFIARLCNCDAHFSSIMVISRKRFWAFLQVIWNICGFSRNNCGFSRNNVIMIVILQIKNFVWFPILSLNHLDTQICLLLMKKNHKKLPGRSIIEKYQIPDPISSTSNRKKALNFPTF
ncbi:unnamed protein product [Caenorhabditis angaria]|uniref:Uncharacterized protein n=1 Tax=Caenorhabditis angaria TaxID=860376 RepID=A0A9P1IKV8_9PELO|nr:unnamed protein product [Caenorhabditis angaria]